MNIRAQQPTADDIRSVMALIEGKPNCVFAVMYLKQQANKMEIKNGL